MGEQLATRVRAALGRFNDDNEPVTLLVSALAARLAEAEALLRESCGYIDDVPDARSNYKDRVRAHLAREKQP